MNSDPFHVDYFSLEDEQVDQIIINSIWATRIAFDRSRGRLRRKPAGPGTIRCTLDTEGRADVHALLDDLHANGADYTAKWSVIDADNRHLFVLKLGTPVRLPITIAGPRTPQVDRALLRAKFVALAPALEGAPNGIDAARVVVIDNDTEFWQHTIGRNA